MKTRSGEISASPFVSGHTLPPSQRFFLDVHPGSVVYTLDFPMAPLLRKVEALTGERASADAFVAEVDLESGPGAALVRNVLATFNELETLATVGLSSLAVAGFSELLANLGLAAALPDMRAQLAETPASVAPRLAERARQQLAAHAHEPIRITDLAGEMGVSVRALQAGFQRHFGCSPLQYLIRCRVDLARARLLSPEPADTVSSIAMDCGFMNPTAFAHHYRRAFGELPSATLSASRR